MTLTHARVGIVANSRAKHSLDVDRTGVDAEAVDLPDHIGSKIGRVVHLQAIFSEGFRAHAVQRVFEVDRLGASRVESPPTVGVGYGWELVEVIEGVQHLSLGVGEFRTGIREARSGSLHLIPPIIAVLLR